MTPSRDSTRLPAGDSARLSASERSFEHPRLAMRRLGIAPRKRLSQSFLCQPQVARRIVDAAGWDPATPILEIGGGTGVLTDAIAAVYQDLVVIEIDRALAAHLRERYSGADGARVRVVEADAREIRIEDLRAPGAGVFGNLPYSITTDLLLLLIAQRHALRGAVVMVQREYAERLVARPGSKAYASLSIFAAFHLDMRFRFRVGRGSFYPPPQVDSTVLGFGFREPPPGVDGDFLERVVRGAFRHRRKLLKSNLAVALDLDGLVVADAIREVAGDEGVRAETLSPEEFLRLAQRLTEVSRCSG